METFRDKILFKKNRESAFHTYPNRFGGKRAFLLLALAALTLAGIAYGSNVLLAPRNDIAAPVENREKPDAQQATKATGEQLGIVFEDNGSKSNSEMIGLSDKDAISSLTDPQWGSGSFSTAVIARAIADGYQIDAAKSGILRDSIREEQEGAIVYGSICIFGKTGEELGTLPFAFNKETSDLSFANDPSQSEDE